MTPFKALYGRDPPLLFKGSAFPSGVEAVNQLATDRDLLLDELKQNLTQTQQQMKVQADKKRGELVFQICGWVYLKSQSYIFRSKRRNEKLSPRFYEPYQITQRVGEAAD